MSRIIRRETRKRGAFGKIMKWTFIAFSVAMFSAVIVVHNAAAAHHAGPGAGALASSGIIMLWVVGTIILGPLVAFTRGPLVITEETLAG